MPPLSRQPIFSLLPQYFLFSGLRVEVRATGKCWLRARQRVLTYITLVDFAELQHNHRDDFATPWLLARNRGFTH